MQTHPNSESKGDWGRLPHSSAQLARRLLNQRLLGSHGTFAVVSSRRRSRGHPIRAFEATCHFSSRSSGTRSPHSSPAWRRRSEFRCQNLPQWKRGNAALPLVHTRPRPPPPPTVAPRPRVRVRLPRPWGLLRHRLLRHRTRGWGGFPNSGQKQRFCGCGRVQIKKPHKANSSSTRRAL